MMPIGPLMIEHRLIERMIRLMLKEYDRMEEDNRANVEFLNNALDFLEIYADRCHHGKEEDILFRELENKKLSSEHRRMMNELIEEHGIARNSVARLRHAKSKYAGGDLDQVDLIRSTTNDLIQLYPAHIIKEDKYFFLPVMEYFSKDEQESMLNEFREFDRSLIHEEYRNMVERMEKKS